MEKELLDLNVCPGGLCGVVVNMLDGDIVVSKF